MIICTTEIISLFFQACIYDENGPKRSLTMCEIMRSAQNPLLILATPPINTSKALICASFSHAQISLLFPSEAGN
jgi:hypothetical protein